MSKNPITLPIKLKVADKTDLIFKVITLWGAITSQLTEKNISVISFMILHDSNSDVFPNLLIKNGIVKTKEHYRTEMNRLHKKGLISYNEKRQKVLHPNLEILKKLLNVDLENNNIAIRVEYEKK
jgi:hypothetical protein